MALTKLTDIRKSLSAEVNNLKVSGITTFTGSVSIGGTLTYQDVTNVDSVGIITAQAGINVSGGQLDVGSNIKLGNAGVITATRIVSTIGTFTGDTAISGSLQIADTIQHEGDVNTKIRFPAVDTFSVETAGSERLRITSAGQMVMGATTSKAKFEIKDNGYSSSTVLQRISGDDANPYALIIANDTCNTAAASGLQLFVSDSGEHYVRARASSTAGNNNLRLSAQNNVILYSGSSETERLRIASNGGIGIATDKIPRNYFLHIAAPSQDYTNTSTQLTDGGGIMFQHTDTLASTGRTYPGIFWSGNTSALGRARAGIIGVTASNNDATHIAFLTRIAANGTSFYPSDERMRIASNGDVGIGTNSPLERFHVHKASATGPFMYITNTSTGVSASDGIQIGYDGTNTAVLKNNEPTDLVFYAGSQNFRITSSGHVLPATNNTQDLGSTAKGWRNVYMNDLNLSNMNGDTNDVDGTQGSWTIQEGKDDLYIINRLNGKKFKIKMEEIS